MEWSPKAKVVFSDEEIVRTLAATRDAPEHRNGNWYTFFCSLPKPERDRLEQEAEKMKPQG